MALHLDLLHTTLDAAVNARRTLELLDVSSALGGVTKSDCRLAKNIADNISSEHGPRLLAALFLIGSGPTAEAAARNCQLEYAPHPHTDYALLALNFLKVQGNYTRAEGIRRLAETLCDIPSVALLRTFSKDQLIALRDLIGFASVSGITEDPDASVTSVAAALKSVTHSDE